jgi:hypothetical protein
MEVEAEEIVLRCGWGGGGDRGRNLGLGHGRTRRSGSKRGREKVVLMSRSRGYLGG